MDKKEMREQLGRLVHESRVLIDLADKEERSFTAEEEETYQRLDKEISQTEASLHTIERHDRLEERESYLESRVTEPTRPEIQGADGGNGGNAGAAGGSGRASAEYRDAFSRYLQAGEGGLNQWQHRALSAGVGAEGGYAVPEEQFVNELIQRLDDMMPLRTIARGFQVTNAASLGAPVLDTDPADADWTTELETGGEDSSMDFAKRELNPYPLAKLLKVSNKLLRNSALPIDSIVQERMAYKIYTPLETAYMTGDGSNKPLGLFTASAAGISTDRDVDVGDGAGALDADDWITARYTLKQPYWARGQWLFHRNVLAAVRKLKAAATGNYLWQPGLAAGAPATFLDLPYVISEFAPGTVSTGNYLAMLGDFSFYWYADALDFTIQRLVELYAETNQTGFITRGEFDGMPVLEDAFVRIVFTA
jgi:HK97 family phage major capsid protein